MKISLILSLSVFCLAVCSGCYDQMALEDTTLTLMLGLDLDDKNNLIVYQQSPVFYKEAQEKSESIGVKVSSIREARSKFDAVETGLTTGGKIQTILLGKRLIKQRQDWYSLLDVLSRDPKQTVTSRMVIVDGPVGDIFEFKPKDKPRLALHMRKLIDTANHRIITTSTTLQDLSWQMEEKGTTPSLSNVKLDKEQIWVTGTGLLHKDGSYATSLGLQESSLLLLLQGHAKGEISLSVPVSGMLVSKDQNAQRDQSISLTIKKSKKKIKTRLNAQNGFDFDVDLNLAIDITSRNFELNIAQSQEQLEEQIAAYFGQALSDLVSKCQAEHIDPFGFGLHARAYEYAAWKPVQNNWAEAFAEAKVSFTTKVSIKAFGAKK
ncbi:hypothetical protein A8709_15430 [Paenibacillus pectinilyticus]|uniref:Uncharacterized protein n=1 Tax=Paenibacillus pectinilyticus TaxID=512399 RepID=A0A1C1A4K2_9BACL|nr:Ger(x)C family spore germination protein [Paenibacillus pectinilyticus]OCT15466.1 hypothetical protein A8709_15430 [Paenibacillus pectinilyticus]